MPLTAEQIQAFQRRAITAARSVGVPAVNAQIIAAQATHESGKFSSNVFLTDNNCFGMKVPVVRKSPYITGRGLPAPKSEGANLYYAHYKTMEDSVKDLVHWCTYKGVNWTAVATPESYALWLQSKSYYTDVPTTYVAALRRYFDTFKTWVLTSNKTLLITGLALCCVAYFAYKKM